MKSLLSILLALFLFPVLAAVGLPAWLDAGKSGSFQIEATPFQVSVSASASAAGKMEKPIEPSAPQTVFRADSADSFFLVVQSASNGEKREDVVVRFRISGVGRVLQLAEGKDVVLPDRPSSGEGKGSSPIETEGFSIPLDSGSRLSLSGRMILDWTDERRAGKDSFVFSLRPLPSDAGTPLLEWKISLSPVTYSAVDLSQAANMGFRDSVPGDGKGGWTDQGPGNDLHEFRCKTLPFGKAAFRILDPEKNQGRATLVLGNRFPREISLPVHARGRYLYLLHATSWTVPQKAGEVEVHFADGSSQKIDIFSTRDVGNWWNPADFPNGVVFWEADTVKWHRNFAVYKIGLYASCFPLRREDPVRLTFRGVHRQIWMIPAVTLTSDAVPLPGVRRPFFIAEGKEWIRLDVPRTVIPGSPLDFSRMLDAPAGKYGRVIAAPEGGFTFEKAPEKRIRFVGVNLCFGAQFLSHAESDRLADRLARMGYNALRIHHQDNLLVRKDAPDSLTMDPEMMDRLDYLFAACRKRGIYVTTDLYVSRKLKAGDKIPEWIPNGHNHQMKSLVPISRAAMENWKEFARRWLCHRNPYTGLTWAEDPALYSVSLINENNLDYKYREEPELAKLYRKRYAAFLKKRYPGEADREKNSGESRRFLEFLYTLQQNAIQEQMSFLRNEIGLKALRTDVNMAGRIPLALIRNRLDTVDDHKYHDHRRSAFKRWGLPYVYRQISSIGSLGNEMPLQLFAPRLFGKPFSVTEYKFCPPNRYRSEGGPLIGAYAALQGWDALYQFAWAQSPLSVRNDRPLESFEMVNDPLAQLSDRIVMFLFRRGDVKGADGSFAWNVPEDFWKTDQPIEYPQAFSRLGLLTRIGSVVGGKAPEGVRILSPAQASGREALPDPALQALRRKLLQTGIAESSTGEIRLDSKRKTLAIETSRTVSAVLASGDLNAGILTVRGAESPMSITLCSLDGEPVARSRKLLLFHLTNVIDSGTAFDGAPMQFQTAWGKLPHLLRRSPAEIVLKLEGATPVHVEALRLDGSIGGRVPSTFSDGVLSFRADPGALPGGVMVYWITRQREK